MDENANVFVHLSADFRLASIALWVRLWVKPQPGRHGVPLQRRKGRGCSLSPDSLQPCNHDGLPKAPRRRSLPREQVYDPCRARDGRSGRWEAGSDKAGSVNQPR